MFVLYIQMYIQSLLLKRELYNCSTKPGALITYKDFNIWLLALSTADVSSEAK